MLVVSFRNDFVGIVGQQRRVGRTSVTGHIIVTGRRGLQALDSPPPPPAHPPCIEKQWYFFQWVH